MRQKGRERERETCNTSNQGRVSERERVTTTERQRERVRETCTTRDNIQGRVRGGGEREREGGNEGERDMQHE